MKALGDVMFCDGVNRFVFSSYAHQPWLDRRPGMTVGQLRELTTADGDLVAVRAALDQDLGRCKNLLRQGLFVADVCCLQTEDVPSCSGYQAADHRPAERRRRRPAGHGATKGTTTTAVRREFVLTRMRVQRGRIVLPDGMSYRLMALPPGRDHDAGAIGKDQGPG